MPSNEIVVVGAREHNLKGVDLRLPRDRLIVFTGLSGSGKSSLAFDTIYQEGQRRFMESLSAYARQFLGKMEKLAPYATEFNQLTTKLEDAFEQEAVLKKRFDLNKLDAESQIPAAFVVDRAAAE